MKNGSDTKGKKKKRKLWSKLVSLAFDGLIFNPYQKYRAYVMNLGVSGQVNHRQ